MKAFLLVAAIAGCTDFQTIDRGVCGNGVVEPGEDCDSSEETCVQCAITCGTGTCPDGFACGTDRVCHAPGGGLLPEQAVDNVSVNDFTITDVNQDHIGDFVGLSSTSLDVRLGAPSGTFTASQTFLTPAQTGSSGFAVDAQGVQQFVLPSEDGLVVYSSRFGLPQPVATPAAVLGTGASILGVVGFKPDVLGIFVSGLPSATMPHPRVFFSVVDFATPQAPLIQVADVCGATFDDFDASTLDSFDASKALSDDHLISFLVGTGATRTPCVVSVHLNGAASTVNFPIPATAPMVASKPVLAQLDLDNGDPCPHVLLSTAAGILDYDGKNVGASCGFAAGGPSMLKLNNGATASRAVGRIRLEPTVPLFAVDAVVTPDGLLAVAIGDNAYTLYTSVRPLKGAVSVDLNHDGYSDGLLIPEGTDDIDVLIRGNQSTNQFGYETLRIDTAAEPSTVLVADFDGNGALDVEYIEPSNDHVRMMIAYNTSDGLLPPVQVAAFDAVGNVAPLATASYEDQLSIATDLVVTIPSDVAPLLTILVAGPQRTMTPIFEPRIGLQSLPQNQQVNDFPNYRDTTTFHTAQIGDFDGDGAGDLLAIATRVPNYSTPAKYPDSDPIRAWVVPTIADGTTELASAGLPVSGFADCRLGEAPGLCVDARYAPVGKGFVAVDRYNRVATIAVASGKVTATAVDPMIALGDARVDALFTLGDQVIAAFGDGPTHAGVVMSCSAAMTSCTDLMAVVKASAPDVVACTAATTAVFSPGGAADLVVACRDAHATNLYRIAGGAASALASGLASPVSLIRAGDVDGDGVDDLAVIHGAAGGQTLGVLRQCTTLDRSCGEAK